MNRLNASDLAAFQRKYRFTGAILRRVRIRNRGSKNITIDFRISIRQTIKDLGTSPKQVQLVLRVEGVEEYRLQMRPHMPKVKIGEARLGFFNGSFFVNLDAWGLDPGEQPRVLDFRASEQYAAGRDLLWEEVQK